MELSNSASALGLYKYDCDYPPSELFQRFHATIAGLFEVCGVALTHFGAEGRGYSDKLSKISGRMYENMLRTEFAGLSGMSLLANPPESNAPAYDSFASATLNYVEVNRELLACIVVNQAFMRLRTPEYDSLLRSLVELYLWDFGYGFSSSVEKQPEFYILGLDNGKLSAEEYKSLSTWYSAPGEVRRMLLRDVYPYNVLNETQLDTQISKGMTLRQFAESQLGCSLIKLTSDGLHLWQVPDAQVARLREVLFGSAVMLT
jgi:hypothetical protein